jgi:hypothetical protein
MLHKRNGMRRVLMRVPWRQRHVKIALIFADQLGVQRVTMETDCLQLV